MFLWDHCWRDRWMGRVGNWCVEFIRNFNDWEIDELASFFHLLDSHTVLGEGNDRMIWKLKSNGEFIVWWLSSYAFFLGRPYGGPKHLGKTILCGNLIKVGFSMVSRCCMCCCIGETMNHLLICCCIDFELRNFIFRMFGVQWVLPKKGFRFIVWVAMSWTKFGYLESSPKQHCNWNSIWNELCVYLPQSSIVTETVCFKHKI